MWEFPRIRGTLFWGSYNKDPRIFTVLYKGPPFSEPPCALESTVYNVGGCQNYGPFLGP